MPFILQVFSPKETTSSPLVLHLIFCQIVSDVLTKSIARITNSEKTEMLQVFIITIFSSVFSYGMLLYLLFLDIFSIIFQASAYFLCMSMHQFIRVFETPLIDILSLFFSFLNDTTSL